MKQRAKRFADAQKRRGNASRPGKKCKKCHNTGFLKTVGTMTFGIGNFPCPCKFKK